MTFRYYFSFSNRSVYIWPYGCSSEHDKPQGRYSRAIRHSFSLILNII